MVLCRVSNLAGNQSGSPNREVVTEELEKSVTWLQDSTGLRCPIHRPSHQSQLPVLTLVLGGPESRRPVQGSWRLTVNILYARTPQAAQKDVCGADATLGTRDGRTRLQGAPAEDRKLLPSNWAWSWAHTRARYHQAHPELPRTKMLQDRARALHTIGQCCGRHRTAPFRPVAMCSVG